MTKKQEVVTSRDDKEKKLFWWKDVSILLISNFSHGQKKTLVKCWKFLVNLIEPAGLSKFLLSFVFFVFWGKIYFQKCVWLAAFWNKTNTPQFFFLLRRARQEQIPRNVLNWRSFKSSETCSHESTFSISKLLFCFFFQGDIPQNIFHLRQARIIPSKPVKNSPSKKHV